MAEVVQQDVDGGGHGRQRAEAGDEGVAGGERLLGDHRPAVVVEHRDGDHAALVVDRLLVELHRERAHQVLHDVLAGREVDGQVVVLGGRDLGEAAVEERLAGGDELHDGGASRVEVGLHGADQRRALHRGEEVREEALLRLLEGAHRGGLGARGEGVAVLDHAARLEGGVEVLVDDAEGARVLVPDVPLRVGERMLEDVDFDAVVGERAGLVEAERLQVAGDDLHGRDAAALHGADEVEAVGEGRGVAAPQAQAGRVGEAVHGRGAGGAGVEDAGVGQGVLQAQAGESLLRGLRLAALLRGVAGGVRHRVRLVEDDDAVEGVAVLDRVAAGEPGEDLVEARGRAAACGGAQRGVGGEQDARRAFDGLRGPVGGQREDLRVVLADLAPIAAGVVDEPRRLADPQGALRAPQPAVEDDGGGLSALAAPGAVAEHPALPEAHGRAEFDGRVVEFGVLPGVGRTVRARGVGVHPVGAHVVGRDPVQGRQQAVVGLAAEGDGLELRIGQQAVLHEGGRQHRPVVGDRGRDVGHGGGLDQRGGVLGGAGDAERRGRPGRPDRAAVALGTVGLRDGLDPERRRLRVRGEARRQGEDARQEVGGVVGDEEGVDLGVPRGRRRRSAFEDDEAGLGVGAAAAVDASRDPRGEQDARGVGPPEGVAPGRRVGDAGGGGDGHQAPAWRERRVGGLDVREVDADRARPAASALADGGPRGEGRVHEHDVGADVRKPVADALGVVRGDRGLGIDGGEQVAAHGGELVQVQVGGGVEDARRERGEDAGARGRLEDHVVRAHGRGGEGGVGEGRAAWRTGRRRPGARSGATAWAPAPRRARACGGSALDRRRRGRAWRAPSA